MKIYKISEYFNLMDLVRLNNRELKTSFAQDLGSLIKLNYILPLLRFFVYDIVKSCLTFKDKLFQFCHI